MNNKYTLEDILDKFVGTTYPVGETNHDNKAYDNLDKVEQVINWVISRLDDCRRAKNNYQGSMIAIAKKAREIAVCYREDLIELSKMSDKEKERELTDD